MKLSCIGCTILLAWMILTSSCAPIPLSDALSIADNNAGGEVAFSDKGKSYMVRRVK